MKNKQIYLLLLLQGIIAVLSILFFDGTGDAGDSILHYLFAKYSFVHPSLLFDHWAKPLFVLLASPFAQFGFIGIKIFNTIVALLTTFFTYKTLQALQINNALMGSLILVFTPLFYILTFSGLTEPLFGLFLIMGIYFALANRIVLSCIIISFLPFIRSEGLFYLGIFGLYFLIKKNWKLLPLLLFGHVAYSIAGYFFYNDILWVFTKIPYAKLSSTYGKGNLLHFVQQMNFVLGIPIYVLFWVGTLSALILWAKNKLSLEFIIFILLGFFSFFIAHSLFWYWGIFNSMGLKRVLVGVAPLSAIIATLGFNFLLDFFKKNKQSQLFVTVALTLVIVIFPFTNNPAAVNWKKDMSLHPDQLQAIELAKYVKDKHLKNRRFFYSHPYLNYVLNIDPFLNSNKLQLSLDNLQQIRKGDLIIWENWFAVVENGITKENLDTNAKLIQLLNLKPLNSGRASEFAIFECK